MLRSCKYCGRIHSNKFNCGKKPKRNKEPTRINKFRWSRRWREKRNRIVDRDNGLCMLCRANGKYVYDDLEVHHIVRIEDDYNVRLDEDNLITLCVYHHKKADKGEISKEYLREILTRSYGYNYQSTPRLLG